MNYFLIIMCFFLSLNLFSQTESYWVFFTNKDCDNYIQLGKDALNSRLKNGISLDQYDLSVCQKYIDSLIDMNIEIRYQSRWLNAVSISIGSETILTDLDNFSFVKKVTPVRKFIKDKSVSDTNKNVLQTNRTNSSIYGPSFNQLNMLGGVDLHNQGFLGDDIIISVFDAGFNGVDMLPIFNQMWDNSQIIDMYDFVGDDDDVFHGSSHGTMVLSTLVGYMPDSLIGSAPNAQYMLFRTEDSDSETLVEEDYWVAAAEYADSMGTHIINSSLGYTIMYDDTLNSHSYSDMDGNSTIITKAADLASSKGILVVNSAGNSGGNDWYYIGAPADGDSVLAVGAVNNLGDIASFSSRGPTFDGRIKPNVCAQGVSTVVADLDSTIRLANGTSFSSPIIAGLSACLWQVNPSYTNMDIFYAIQQSAHLYNNPNDSLGYGIPNFFQAYLDVISSSLTGDFCCDLYPNPFYFDINFCSDILGVYDLKVLDISGKILFRKNIDLVQNCIKLDELAHLKNGFYLLKVQSQNLTFCKQILKINE